ncbi:PIF1-like helicase [Hirsutella rhossiliensis]
MLSTDGADIDDTLARYGDTEPTIAHPGSDLNQQGPRMLVDISPTVALQLVCAFLDRYTANQDSADSHHDPNKPPPPFSEAKKWIWKQKLVLVIDEVSMLGGATLHNVSRHLQALRDCPDEPFGGMPVVLLMGDFYQFAPVRETSLLINRPPDRTQTPLRQATISPHSGCRLWHMFKTVVLLEDQVRALLDRVRNGRQTQQDLSLLNTNIDKVTTPLARSPVFFYAQGMPVVVNKNIYTGLKVDTTTWRMT